MNKIVIVYPMDPLGSKIGGVETFLKGFIGYAPDDFHFRFIGITSDRRVLPLRKAQTLAFGTKRFEFFPVFEKKDENRRDLIPLSFRFTLALLRFRVRTGPGVLFFNRIEPSLAFRRRENPKIGFIHSDIPRQLTAGATDILWSRWPRGYALFENAVFKHLDTVFTNNRNTLNHYVRRYPWEKDKFIHIPTWVDPEVFSPASEPKHSTRAALRSTYPFLPPDEPWIIFAGRLQKVKDPFLAIDGFLDFRQRHRSGVLIVIGEGNLKAAMIERIRRRQMEDKIFLFGEMVQKELAAFYRASDVLISTSRYEGGPRSVLEALGSGTPVVTTDVGEVRRVVKNGFSGEIVDGRSSSIGEAIVRIINRPEAYSAARCLESVEDLTPRKVLHPVYEKIRELSANVKSANKE